LSPPLEDGHGINGVVESASQLLLQAGYDPQRARTERFWPGG
jgi:hypothetical protein